MNPEYVLLQNPTNHGNLNSNATNCDQLLCDNDFTIDRNINIGEDISINKNINSVLWVKVMFKESEYGIYIENWHITSRWTWPQNLSSLKTNYSRKTPLFIFAIYNSLNSQATQCFTDMISKKLTLS